MTAATMTSKGQITIPAIVRTSLGVKAGDRVEFVEVEPGRFELVAATQSVTALKGLVRKKGVKSCNTTSSKFPSSRCTVNMWSSLESRHI